MKFIRKAIKFLIKNKEYYKNAIIPLFIYALEVLTGGISALIISISHRYLVALLILPQLITLRGDIAGVYSAHISTGLNTGKIKLGFKNNTEIFYSIIFGTLIIALVFRLIVAIFWGLIYVSMKIFIIALFIVLMSYVINVFISVILTAWFAFIATKKALNPDLILYPLASVINDFIVATTLYITVLTIEVFSTESIEVCTILLTFLVFIILLGLYLNLDIKLNISLKIIRESFISILVGFIFSTINSSILSNSIEKFKQEPSFAILWPILISALGGQASAISCFYTTQLYMGYIKEIKEFFKEFGKNLISSYFFSLLLAGIFYATLATIIALSFNRYFLILMITLLTILTSFTMILLIALLISSITFSFGLDPDNFTIPLITSISDFLVTAILVEFIMLFFLE